MEHKNQSESVRLREKAEEVLKNKKSGKSYESSGEELLRIVHELEVYQIELELQNEALKLAREQSEITAQKYTSLYDFAPIGYFTLSDEGKILDLNLSGAKMLGNVRANLKNIPFKRFIPESLQATFGFFLEKTFKNKTKETIELELIGGKDDLRVVQMIAITEDQHEDHCLLTILDITDRKKAELELEEAAKRLKTINSQKDMFFSIIAHDLKNPFSVIIGYCQLLIMEVNNKDYQMVEEISGIIMDSSRKILDLLGNLMDWAKSQTGRMIFNPISFQLAEVIQEVTDIFDLIAKQKNIAIRKEVSDQITINADRDMIATVIRNLVSNAIKFARSGTEIIISARESTDSVTFSVKDFGVGIPPYDLAKLFRIDASLSRTGTNNEKGTGLGLILCKEFVERHGGKIWVETEKDQGSTFFVSIPR
jgi:PAS domain S-box-containing protein